MIPQFRHQFIDGFSQEKYQQFLVQVKNSFGVNTGFHLSETPVFFSKALTNELISNATDILHQAIDPDLHMQTVRSIPEKYNVPGPEGDPHFIQIDFALVELDGLIVPKLIELQGFPSLYAFQPLLSKELVRYAGAEKLNLFPNPDMTIESYFQKLKDVIVGDEDPAQVVLLEIDPENQKTYVDFHLTKRMIGVEPICVTKIKKKNGKYYYQKNGKDIQIKRFYNRIIFDEYEKKNIQSDIDFQTIENVKWITHPNWYYRISKFILPYLKHPTVPQSYFLHELPIELDYNKYVLKPLFSFAGSGVKIDVTADDIHKISKKEKPNFILQEKVEYAPLIETLDDPAKMEVRVMFLKTESGYECTNFLIRLSKGKMMGVDFNKNKTWVGSAGALFE